jgi:signal transduction histidine kinase
MMQSDGTSVRVDSPDRLQQELNRRSAALAESEARFDSIVERTADGIVIVAEDGRIRFANPCAEKMFGRTAEDLVGQDLGLPVLAGETTEMDILPQGGREPVVAELRASATTWEGAPAYIISLRDMTDRKHAEERAQRLLLEQAAREEAEKAALRFRFLANAGATLDASLNAAETLVQLAELIAGRVADWCLIDLLEAERIHRAASAHADPERQPLLASMPSPRPATRVLQSGAAELHVGLNVDTMSELAVDDAHAQLLLRLGTRSSITVPLDAREFRLGTMTFVSGSRDFDDADFAFAVEIASRAARALENSRLYEAALMANRAKSDFLAVMSHELRTPLNAIMGYADLLSLGVAGAVDTKQADYLRRIDASASQLLHIIEEVLAYAQMEAGRAEAHPETIRLGDPIYEVIDTAEPLIAEKGLTFRQVVPQPDAALYTDGGKLGQLVLNLLTNAVKFTERGSVTLSATMEGEDVVIAVTDTGIGIAPGELEHVFAPFQQVEQGKTRRAGGSGLGLSVSRQLARLLGGDLTVESKLGSGSTFTVRLPRRLPPVH